MTNQHKPPQTQKGPQAPGIPIGKVDIMRKGPLGETLSGLRGRHIESGLKDGKSSLSIPESKRIILLGNEEHVKSLQSLPLSPVTRYNEIITGNAGYLVVACSDARGLTMDFEADPLIGMQIRSAGNTVPLEGPSLEEIRDAVARIKDGGLFILLGHCACGAVGEFKKWNEARKTDPQKEDTGSPEMNFLLQQIGGEEPEHNVLAQIERAKTLIDLSRVKTAAVMYDWFTGKVSVLGGDDSPVLDTLKYRWKLMHARADNNGGMLAKRLARQTPHAIAIGSPDLPFSLATIFNAQQNEVFATTGSEGGANLRGGLDAVDEASILYAVEHLHLRHLVFVAPGTESDAGRVNRMFETWENDLRDMLVGGTPLIADMLDSRKLIVTRFRYGLSDGRLAEAV